MPAAGTKLGSGLIRAYLRREAALLDQREDLGGGFGDVGAGAVDRADAGYFEEIVVLRRDDAAADDQNVAGTFALQRFDQRRDEGLVAGSVGRDADNVDVVLDRLAGGFLRCLEQRADIDVEPDIGKGGGDDLGTAVMPILAELGDEHARPTSLFARESLYFALDVAERIVVLILSAVDSADRADLRTIAAKDSLQRLGDLADRRARPHRVDRQCQQVTFPAF